MNLLVPTDFSEVANAAIQYAAMLAGKLDARIILMHVVPPHSMWWSLPDEKLLTDARHKQEIIKTKLVKQGVEAGKIELQVFYRFPLNEWINDFVRKNKIDFTIVGTSGTGLNNALLGSFAIGLIQHLSVPVFAVPPGFKLRSISNILYPVDLEDPDEDITRLLKLAKTFDACIHMVHITSKKASETLFPAETLHKMAGKTGYKKITTTVKTGDKIEMLIEESIQEVHADLLVMFPKSRGFFEQIFHGSVSEEVSHIITIPLLTIQKGDADTYPEHADF